MKLTDIRKELEKGKRIEDLPLRVTFYARVSTGKDEQLNSLDSQIKQYMDQIQMNLNWTYVPGYVDEGVSGKSIEGRTQFNQMIEDAKDGQFDLILTKEISRFSRDTVDSLRITRELLDHGVGVKFDSDGILTFSADSELRLTLMASIAQDELRKISSRVKRGLNASIRLKHSVLGNDNIWGYNKCRQTQPDGSVRSALEINEDQAKIIRLIFDLYVSEDMGIRRICSRLTENGYKNSNGNPFSFSTVRKILANPKYKGWYCGGKTSKEDYRSNKIEHLDESQWEFFKDETGTLVPAIVSEEIWNEANRKLKVRREKMTSENPTSYQNKYSYSGKIVCGVHGTRYQRACYHYKSGDKEVWRCKLYSEKGKKGCETPQVYTTELDQILQLAVDTVLVNRQSIIDDLIALYSKVENNPDREDQADKIEKQIQSLTDRKRRLLDVLLDGAITKEEYMAKKDSLDQELGSLQMELDALKQSQKSMEDLKENLAKLRRIIDDELNFEDGVPASVVDSLVDRIEVYEGDTPKTVKLKVFFRIFEKERSYAVCRKRGGTSVCCTSST